MPPPFVNPSEMQSKLSAVKPTIFAENINSGSSSSKDYIVTASSSALEHAETVAESKLTPAIVAPPQSQQNENLHQENAAPSCFAAENAVVESCNSPSPWSNDTGIAASLAVEPPAASEKEVNSIHDIQTVVPLKGNRYFLQQNYVGFKHGSGSEQCIHGNCKSPPLLSLSSPETAAKYAETYGPEAELKSTFESRENPVFSENQQCLGDSGDVKNIHEAHQPLKRHESSQSHLFAKVPTTKMALVKNLGENFDSEITKKPSIEEKRTKNASLKYIGIRSLIVQQQYVFRPCIRVDKKTYILGSYKLQADAARVYDAANERTGKSRTNFASAEEYYSARKKEMKETGIRVSIGEIISYGRKRVTKFMKSISEFEKKGYLKKKPKFMFSLEQHNSYDQPTSDSNEIPLSLDEKSSAKCEKDPQYVGFVLERGAFHGYRVHITYQRKCYKLGKYELQADAARANDLAAEKLGRDHRNFNSVEEYRAARVKEMADTGSIVDYETVDSEMRKNAEQWIDSIPKPIILSTWKKSRYIGVHHLTNRQNPYQTCIHHEAKRYLLGCYRLAADAARAYDEAAKKIRKKVNFPTDAEYLSEREREMEELGIHIDIEEARKTWLKKTELMFAYKPFKQMVPRDCKFIGIFRSDNSSSKLPYQSKVNHKKITISMGSYLLAADAARAFDEAAKLLRKDRMNFESEDHHIIAREGEMDEIGLRINLKEAQQIWRERLEKLRESMEIPASETTPATTNKIKEDLFGDWCRDGTSQTKHSNRQSNEAFRKNDISTNVDPLLLEKKQNGFVNVNTSMKRFQDKVVEINGIEEAKSKDCQPSPKKKRKISQTPQTPKHVGFVRKEGSVNRYRASISYHAKSFDIGRYQLQADAARAYDLAAEKLGRHHRNFKSIDEYHATREKEMAASGILVELEKVNSYMLKKVAQLKEPLPLPMISTYHKGLKFVGVQYRADRPHVPFRTVIHHEGKKYPVGYFKLASDAAHAYDEAAKKFGKDANFISEAEYLAQREREMEETGTRVDIEEANSIMKGAAALFLKRLEDPNARDDRKKFKFVGIRQCDNDNSKVPFRARLRHNNKSYTMGCYKLASDAALAYDIIARYFQKDKFNFETEADFINAREREMEKVGFRVEFIDSQNTWNKGLEKVRKAIENQEKMKKPGTQPVSSDKKKGEYLGVWRPDGDVPNTTKKTSLKRRRSRGQADEASKVDAINNNENQPFLEKKRRVVKKFSNVPHYVGVSTEEGSLEWHHSFIIYIKQRYDIGKYKLRADAARAYDIAAEKLGRFHRNFSSIDDYHMAREKEMVDLGSHIDFQQVDSYMRKKVKAWIDSRPKPLILSDWKKRKYVGVQSRPDRPLMPYRTCIHKDGKKHPVGYYKLAADAARAYDEAARVLNKAVNFKSDEEYLTERETEMEEMGTYVDIQEAKDMWTKSADLFRERLINPNAKIERKKCKFIGVFIIGYESKIPFRPRLRYKEKSFSLGCYHLAADAARAYDEMAKLLKKGKLNFETEDEYIAARESEMEEVGFRVDLKKVQENWPEKLEKMREELQGFFEPVTTERKKREYLGVWRQDDHGDRCSKYFSSMILHNNVTFLLGSYVLATDAARAHDKAARILCKYDVNLKEDEEYHVARELEMEQWHSS